MPFFLGLGVCWGTLPASVGWPCCAPLQRTEPLMHAGVDVTRSMGVRNFWTMKTPAQLQTSWSSWSVCPDVWRTRHCKHKSVCAWERENGQRPNTSPAWSRLVRMEHNHTRDPSQSHQGFCTWGAPWARIDVQPHCPPACPCKSPQGYVGPVGSQAWTSHNHRVWLCRLSGVDMNFRMPVTDNLIVWAS